MEEFWADGSLEMTHWHFTEAGKFKTAGMRIVARASASTLYLWCERGASQRITLHMAPVHNRIGANVEIHFAVRQARLRMTLVGT